MFLHERGYNYFEQGRLTYPEINALINGWNLEQEKKIRQANELKNKYKSKGR